MSMQSVIEAFQRAADGKLNLTRASMTYAAGNAQVFHFDGTRKDGTPFHFSSEPAFGDPTALAAQIGAELAAK